MRISLLLILSTYAQAAPRPSGVINHLLERVTQSAYSVKATESSNISTQILLDADLFVFEPTAYIRGSYNNQKVIPTSPFSPSNSRAIQYELGVSKLWTSGIQSDLNYLYQNNATYFPARSNFIYQTPKVQLTLTTSIFQDLVYNRYSHLVENKKLSKKASKLSSKIDKKSVIVKSLIDFSALLEQEQSLNLQTEICKQTRTQSKHLAVKRKRRSVSAREYLLGVKELTNCLANIDNLKKKLIEAGETFEADYNISYDEFKEVDTDDLFREAQALYKSMHPGSSDISIDNQDEIKSLDIQIDALESKQSQLEAQSQTNLALEVRSGLSGIGHSFGNSNQDITKLNYPFVYLGLKMDLPLKDRNAVAQAGANQYQLRANRYQRDLLKKQKDFRFKTLEKTLVADFEIYKKYKKAVEISKRVIEEGRKDFLNGRLDFNGLTELNKSLIADQRTLSSHRISLIVRVVEYLDFYQFFDHYLQ